MRFMSEMDSSYECPGPPSPSNGAGLQKYPTKGSRTPPRRLTPSPCTDDKYTATGDRHPSATKCDASENGFLMT